MEAHYFQYDLQLNKLGYLFIPEKNILIALEPAQGKLRIKNRIRGRFLEQEDILWAQEIISKKKKEEHTIYIGKIELPRRVYKKIISLEKKYNKLEKFVAKLEGQSIKEVKDIEKLVKEKFPKSFQKEFL